ncbi:Pca regulon regulatory protein PcaR [Klebsiella pneumoniae]|uniref:Pca regulon regulatory protein PcaR n=1 Tax=Klebsiella pneumoniae TaxID=573 RepID=A0A3S4G9N0_KLEPN|nr:Pca regulon regulatory protein PcaR [Klebsiella pneumoniae]
MSDNIPNTLSARQAEHDPNFMLSLARGLEVLNAFTPQRQRLTISQLSQKTQISRAAVRRCLYTLAALGMVHSPDGRSYELLPGCWPSATPIWQARRWPRWRSRRWIILAKRSANPVRRPRSTGITCSILPARRSIIY